MVKKVVLTATWLIWHTHNLSDASSSLKVSTVQILVQNAIGKVHEKTSDVCELMSKREMLDSCFDMFVKGGICDALVGAMSIALV